MTGIDTLWEIAHDLGRIVSHRAFLAEKDYFGKVAMTRFGSLIHDHIGGTDNFEGYRINYLRYCDYAFLLSEIFQKGSYYFKTDNLEPKILDVGSNIGISALFFMKLYDADIMAFEPDPTTFKVLQANVVNNNLQNKIHCNNFAISNKEGTVPFYNSATLSGELCMSLKEHKDAKNIIQVPCRKLSDFIIDRVDLLKMDVEGEEANIIRELVSSTKIDLVDRIIMEYHDIEDKSYNPLEGILTLLDICDFHYKIIGTSVYNPYMDKDFKTLMVYADKNGFE